MADLIVATLNLNLAKARWLRRRHLVVAHILNQQPDLLALQQVALPIRQSQWLCQQVNLRLSGEPDKPYMHVARGRYHPVFGRIEGVAILSRLPILASDSVDLGFGGRVALRINVETADQQAVDFVSVYLHPLPHEQENRLEQVLLLFGWLHGATRVVNQIIAGGYQERPDGLAVAHTQSLYGYRSAYAAVHGRDPLATFPTVLAKRAYEPACLDYIFVSPGVRRVTDAAIFANRADEDDAALFPSDHVGLLARLELGR